MKFLVRLYDYFVENQRLLWLGVAIITCLLIVASTRLQIREDIAEFLPFTQENKQAMDLYQQFAHADRIMVIFEDTTANVEALLDAVDDFEQQYKQSPLHIPLTTQIDLQNYMEAMRFVYEKVPYFLQENDYKRMDSLLANPNYIAEQMQHNYRQLLLPFSSFLSQRIQADPLNLYAPLVQQLQQFQPTQSAFEMLDGYMLSADHTRAFAYLTSPFGASETQHNTDLVHQLQQIINQSKSNTGVDIRLLGAPVIAVENARQIRHDTILALVLSLVLIVLILVRNFRTWKGVLGILVTILFGWLFATAVVAMVCEEISLIVFGIGSILLGIAVNYPLHIVVHRRYTQDMRSNLQEVLSPLIIGNITTIMAFVVLVPLSTTALRDLGIFAASMLVGTIAFSVVVLPHFLPKQGAMQTTISPFLQRLSSQLGQKKSYVGIAILAITLVLFWFIPSSSFDENLSNINYMTEQQRADFAYYASLFGEKKDTRTIYFAVQDSTENLTKDSEKITVLLDSLKNKNEIIAFRSANQFLPSIEEQKMRLERWKTFWEKHKIEEKLQAEATKNGFQKTAFAPFLASIKNAWQPENSTFFAPLTTTFLQENYRQNCIVNYIVVTQKDEQKILHLLHQSAIKNTTEFSVENVNQQVIKTLSDNFNYIGIACSLIVFLFLWLSFRRFLYAIIAFVPMLLSWIWILGLMGIFGLQFNIVNIILATFIFGQGDDYTIFMVEGLIYERETNKPILPQFRSEILLSAIIILVGIGVLIVAKHPAMFSLGAVTLIGMASVVFMAFYIPPLLFAMVKKNER